MTDTATSPGQLAQNLFTFTNPGSGTHFLVDTGAAVSIFPASREDIESRPMSTSVLSAANGTPIKTFGTRPIPLTVGHFSGSWPFILARVTRPILGADFLRSSGFLVDVRRKRLVQAKSWDTAELRPATGARQIFHLQRPEGEIHEWIRTSYPEILVPKYSEPTAKHGVVLQIPTTGRPVFTKARCLPPDKLAAAKEALTICPRQG